MTRPINHSAAVANACDEYAEDARHNFDGATQDRIDRDLLEIENLARLIVGLARNGDILIGRTEFAQAPKWKHTIASLIVDAYDMEMTAPAHAVLSAMVAKMEVENA